MSWVKEKDLVVNETIEEQVSMLERIEIEEANVLKILTNIKIDKSPEPNQICPRLLWEARNVIASPLAKIFASLLSTSVVPEEWREASVIPLFKKGNMEIPGNYRPLIDPGKVQTVLESSIGYAVTTLQLLTAFWFLRSTYKIVQHHPEKWPFYHLFFPAFALWFFAVPISSLFGQFMIVNWKRERIMNTVSLFLKFYVYIVMLFLTRPFQSNLRFPYHIDTSRIALMRYASESQENLEQLGHHIYKNISMTSFINGSSTAPNVPNSSGANIWGLQETNQWI
ncbi:transmembrane protein 145 isoform X2 [Hemiscyllium ocellatum]|uniref:transmembrane protein 145 isoform X2 n=1 Tax=Hemiscyllium ocellatum TaxID=170820 RepID=UPI002966702D|nr:transmembrane protein 145 isoform X2 [Hemiscyllium ocellatum]